MRIAGTLVAESAGNDSWERGGGIDYIGADYCNAPPPTPHPPNAVIRLLYV